MLLAHSKPEWGLSAQGYLDHIENVVRLAKQFTSEVDTVAPGFVALWNSVCVAAAVHDCGKLAHENQRVLSGEQKADRLPVPHEDAGALWLLRLNAAFAAMLVYAHHRGLPSIQAEKIKPFTDAAIGALRDSRVAQRMDRELADFQQLYSDLGIEIPPAPLSRMDQYRGVAARIALSCLTDADHTDTASASGDMRPEKRASGRWSERLSNLTQYVGKLSTNSTSPRQADRDSLFRHCSDGPLHSLAMLEAPVGSGKTLAAMAYLLRLAITRGLRRLFVILPYTSIIDQNVRVYRAALTLGGENPEDIVAAVHHKAEFADRTSRMLASHWDSPIIVTTSVQFFEVMASNRPGPLRRFHELPGSAIFLDEAHASLPTHLWRQSWEWIRDLTKNWNCHFLLGSGSLPRLWNVQGLLETSEPVPGILPDDLRESLFCHEAERVRLRVPTSKLDLAGAAAFIMDKPGPRLCIVNTVNNAAALARYLRDQNADTLHLSTALTPRDRERMVRRIESKLRDQPQGDWVLVATSCVEAGMDFSFRTGIREASSLNSLIQTGGRVNRNAEHEMAEVFSVRFEDSRFNRNPQFTASRQVLSASLRENPNWSELPTLATDSLTREFALTPAIGQRAIELTRLERTMDYPGVAEKYQVIEAGTRTVVVDPEIVRRLKNGEDVGWRTVQMGSVQMWAKRAERLGAQPLFDDKEEGLYEWRGEYDGEFLGYMVGVLDLEESRL
jgi:CRISPR-associated endonuclease/helicase Cas3